MEYETRLGSEELLRIRALRTMLSSGEARRRRIQAGFTFGEISAACGVAASTVASWESGEKRPCTRRALVYLEILEQLA